MQNDGHSILHSAFSILHLILSPSGGYHIPDVQELGTDGFQFGHVFDLKFDREHTLAAGEILTEEFLHTDPGGGHGLRHIQQQTITGGAFQLQGGFEGLLLLGGPADTDPSLLCYF